ncbi:MAG: hypothetical protein Kow0063_08970 [Anaerolineae bacterium]
MTLHTSFYLKLGMIALLALGITVWLSPAGLDARAWYQSPLSPVSPLPTLPTQPPAPSPTAAVISPTPTPEMPASAVEGRPSRNTALLVAGGIVLAGLVAGAVVLLVRGQPAEDSTS